MSLLLFTLLFQLNFKSANAFDPTLVLQAVQMVGGMASEVDSAKGVAEELGIGGENEESIQDPRVRKLQEIETLTRELGYTANELNQLNSETDSEGESTARRLDKLRQTIRAGKRIAGLFSTKDDRAKQAAIDSVEIQKQQLRVSLELLGETQTKGLDQVSERLKSQKATRLKLREIRMKLRDMGAMQFGESGILAFPKDAPHIEEAIAVGERLRRPMIGLMLLIMFVRIAYYSINYRGVEAYGDLIRDLVVFCALSFAYPDIVRATLGVAEDLNRSIGHGRLSPVSLDHAFKNDSGFARMAEQFTVRWEQISLVLFTAVGVLFDFVLTLLVPLLPVFIFLSQLLNFQSSWAFALGAFFCVGLWPLFWNIAGLLSQNLVSHDGSLAGVVSGAVIMIGQVLAPALALKLLGASGGMAAVKQSGSSIVRGLGGIRTTAERVGPRGPSVARAFQSATPSAPNYEKPSNHAFKMGASNSGNRTSRNSATRMEG